MALLPEGPYGLAALALIVLGTAVIALRRDVPKAYALGVLILGVYGIQFASLAFDETGSSYIEVFLSLGFSVDRFVDGEWWSPLTSMFIHADLAHLFGNLLILVSAGPALEDRVGAKRFLTIYFVAGLAAVAAHSALAFIIPTVVTTQQIALGASGAIFGILTAFAVRYPRSLLPILLLFFLVRLPAFIVLLIYLGFNLVYMLNDAIGGSGGIAWWGHFAGFIVGLPFAYLLPPDHEAIPRGTKGLPDPDKLEPFATTPKLKEILAKIRQFSPDARTTHDSTFVMAWLDRFFDHAECPTCGRRFRRSGMTAVCENGETRVEFGRA